MGYDSCKRDFRKKGKKNLIWNVLIKIICIPRNQWTFLYSMLQTSIRKLFPLSKFRSLSILQVDDNPPPFPLDHVSEYLICLNFLFTCSSRDSKSAKWLIFTKARADCLITQKKVRRDWTITYENNLKSFFFLSATTHKLHIQTNFYSFPKSNAKAIRACLCRNNKQPTYIFLYQVPEHFLLCTYRSSVENLLRIFL